MPDPYNVFDWVFLCQITVHLRKIEWLLPVMFFTILAI